MFFVYFEQYKKNNYNMVAFSVDLVRARKNYEKRNILTCNFRISASLSAVSWGVEGLLTTTILCPVLFGWVLEEDCFRSTGNDFLPPEEDNILLAVPIDFPRARWLVCLDGLGESEKPKKEI